MRILHVADRLTDRGGAYTHLAGVLDALSMEHDLRLLVGRCQEGLSVPCAVTELPDLNEREGLAVDLDPVVARFEPDVVHVHNVMNPAVLRWASRRGSCVLTIQDHRAFCPGRGKWTLASRVCRDPMTPEVCAACFEEPGYFRRIQSLTRERLDSLRGMRIVVLSEYMKRELVAVGVREGDLEVIPPFVHDLDPRAEADGPPCVLFVGRLVEAKGVRDAVEAWRLSEVGLPLVFAGTGPLRDEIERQGFEVLGWVPRARISRVYRRARALLFPPRWQEPFGIAGLEARAMGVPVVAWESGGIAEWHPGEGLVSWGDRAALADALGSAIGRSAGAPPGFEPYELMARLVNLYRACLSPTPS
jgi:glycosyltransferase involved in cell wall biosynthesis